MLVINVPGSPGLINTRLTNTNTGLRLGGASNIRAGYGSATWIASNIPFRIDVQTPAPVHARNIDMEANSGGIFTIRVLQRIGPI